MSTALIVDDHAGFRASARRLLSTAGYAIAGDAADGESAVAAAELLRPDIVLLDIQLPDIDGFEVARRIALLPSPPVIVLTSSRDALDYGERIQQATADGFISKADLSAATMAELLATAGT